MTDRPQPVGAGHSPGRLRRETGSERTTIRRYGQHPADGFTRGTSPGECKLIFGALELGARLDDLLAELTATYCAN
jgi:hypothetical protein